MISIKKVIISLHEMVIKWATRFTTLFLVRCDQFRSSLGRLGFRELTWSTRGNTWIPRGDKVAVDWDGCKANQERPLEILRLGWMQGKRV